ncbi:MAG: DUF2520 domain-containing protein [Planctomycetes bacterium]|nr:DUF2520 domain-containing protein [Planctomycetota bacterium]
MKVAIIGAGVLGTSLGILLKRAGYAVVAICSRNRRSAQAAASSIGMGEVVGDPAMAALGADLVLLAVPDRAIAGVAIQVAAGGALRKGAVVAHFAGGLPAGILSGVVAAGGHRGALHPLQSFADVETALAMLPDTFFAIEGDKEAVEVLQSVVVTLGGRPLRMGSGSKALYHAAASAASNFVVGLMDYAVELMTRAGIEPDLALPALLPLVRGTLANLDTVGLPDALTGPIARGDVGTIRRHLRALADLPPPLGALYRTMARRTLQVAIAKGHLDDEARSQLEQLLRDDDLLPPPEPLP